MQVSQPLHGHRPAVTNSNPASSQPIPQGEVARYLRMARAIGGRIGNDRAAREDFAGEAVLALVECAARFEPERGNQFMTFAWPVMRGRALDALRREIRAKRPSPLSVPLASPSPSAPLAARLDVLDVLERAGSKLNTNQRLVLDEKYWQGRSLADIARGHGWSAAKARRIHGVAVSRLRKVVGRDQGPWRSDLPGAV